MQPLEETTLLPVPAEVLGDDIVNVRPLNAQGGFSNLFVGHKQDLGVNVVIKRVKMVFHGHLNEQSEARIMTALRHQYLPRIYNLRAASDGYTYTIMERIEGCTLREYVIQHGALDQKQVLVWTKQLCEVVQYMHTRRPKGIIHSDLKPENVMITPQGDICVIDFNASLEAAEGVDLEAIGATPGYAAPEQYNLPIQRFTLNDPIRPLVEAAQTYGKVSYRTDLYAIGAMAYYMLTGYDPKIWLNDIIPLSRYDIILGDGFRSVIEKAMEARQENRYANASAMLHELNDLKRKEKSYRRWNRQRIAAILIVTACMMSSITCVFAGLRTIRAETGSEYTQLVQQAQILRQKNQYSQCQDILMQAISLDRSRAEAYLELGALLYQTGDYQQAVNLMEDIELRQSDAMDTAEFEAAQGQVSYLIGSCYYQLGEYANALANYQLATYFLPQQVEYQQDLAICYAKNGNQALAEETLELLQGMNCPADSLALVQGEINYAYGNYEDAFQNLSRAAELANDASTINRACVEAVNCSRQLGSGWVDAEIALLENGVARLTAAENSLLMQILAEAYLNKSAQPESDSQFCYEYALNYLQQLLDRGYRTFAVEQDMAIVLQYLDRFDQAADILLNMLEEYPFDYRVPMRLALLYADAESEKDHSVRDYTAMGNYWRQAQNLYTASFSSDTEMLRLNELAQQLIDLGWIL